MTIRVMLDTDTPLMLKPLAAILATYADLIDAAQLAQLEVAWGQVVLIDRGLGDPLGKASVIDVEAHARGAAAVPGWYDAKHAAGVKHPTVYADRSTMPAVDTAAGARPISRWYATLDGTAFGPGHTPGIAPAAIQILGAAQLGYHADLSLVFEDGWNPAPAAAAPGWLKQCTADASALAAVLKAHT